ncbi:DUF2357 domain-containing protein [Chitinophaga sp. CF418]|uniref:DUF2357 domain-containing protein n=1 Tax=Chitinophaga sp. CF418 TaxID=1855287 RepID=UPI00091FDFDF|nr:DUF2357 domain-containing protein [Chitinophaga sp. CF418]SHM52535.1 hypothetical protein SAMN05216311_102403 [Chitinophaga sp. CF418]
MSDHQIYKFENEGWGVLKLEILKPQWDFYHPDNGPDIAFSLKGFGKELEDAPFYFFEWQKIHYSYHINQESNFSAPFELRVNNRGIKKSWKSGLSHLLTGEFAFANEVGGTKIELLDANDKSIFELVTEVFPQKMDYRSDYKAMMADISSIVYNLAYDYLKDTFRKSRAKIKGQPIENEWWNILDALFDQLIISLEVIKRQPKHQIERPEQVLPVEKIKSASKRNLNWLVKNGRYANNLQRGINVFPDRSYSHALSSNKQVTYNTYENRFIVSAVTGIIKRLKEFIKHIENASRSGNHAALVKKMQRNLGRLQGLLQTSPYKEAGKFEEKPHSLTMLTRGAGYRDFMHIYILLTRGLELDNSDIFKIDPKNIDVLYEYWCFLKLVQILKEQNTVEIDYQDLIKIKDGKYSVNLKKGEESRVTFKKADTGETTSIYFHKSFKKDKKKIFTYNQCPDYSIEFTKRNYETPFWYLFDAKYRFDSSTDKEKGCFNAPEDSIGQLHRYRDAILHTEPAASSSYKKATKNLGGIILYPYPLSEEKFRENIFFNSIEAVNIGALPFLPSKSSLVSEFLNKLINKHQPETLFEQFIGIDDTEYVKNKDAWTEWVTIGVIQKASQQERIDFLTQKLIYHIPYKKNINSKLFLTKRMLICKAGTKEAFLCNVEKWEIMTKNELRKVGTSWDHRDEQYIVFSLRDIELVSMPEKITPLKFRYTTRVGLNRYLQAPQADKYCFYLTNASSARLYQELKTYGIKFKVKWVEGVDDPSLVEFHAKGLRILSSDKFPDLHYKQNNSIRSLNEVLDQLIAIAGTITGAENANGESRPFQ